MADKLKISWLSLNSSDEPLAAAQLRDALQKDGIVSLACGSSACRTHSSSNIGKVIRIPPGFVFDDDRAAFALAKPAMTAFKRTRRGGKSWDQFRLQLIHSLAFEALPKSCDIMCPICDALNSVEYP